ncbi:hypothetical protein KUV57_13235 [Epibacterium sp. DP7N7-1]|nr:hypothetical protein [Epibacterium sp. DP7N7-1]
MNKIAVTLIVALTLSGCAQQGPTVAARDVYAGSQTSRILAVDTSCRVLDSRAIVIQPDDADAQRRTRNAELAGGIIVGALGYGIGRNIGKGTGRDVATVVGTAAGYQIGRNVGRKGSRSNQMVPGIAYTVKTSRGTRSIVQQVAMTTEVLPAGATCKVVQDRGAARILPR